MFTQSETAFATIPSFPDYQVSNDGQVRRILKSGKFRTINLWPNQKHFMVTLSSPWGTRHAFYIHRLVQQVHGPAQPAHLPLVCHLDDKPWNNAVENLVWGSKQTNAQMAVDNGKLCPSHLRVFLTIEQGQQVREMHAAGHSMRRIAADFGCSRWTISNIVNDRTIRFREVQGNA